MKKRNKIFEFLTLISLAIGIVIGVGEFIKNDGNTSGNVLYESQNAIMSIFLWIIISISCIFMIIGFIEIASSTAQKGNGTISNWIKLFIHPKVASAVSIYWIFFYLPIIYTLFSLMLVNFLLQALNITFNTLTWTSGTIYFLGGLAGFLFFTLMNAFTRKPGKYLQIVGTILKMIPFLMVLVIAFLPFANFDHNTNAFHNYTKPWSISTFFMSIGPILFSFDGFIMSTNLQKEMNNKSLVYKTLIIGIIITAIIYVLEAIALFYGSENGSVIELFQNVFGDKVGNILDLMIVFTICVGLNGVSMAGARYIVTDVNAGLICGFGKKISITKSGVIQTLIGLIWFIILTSLGMFVNTFDPIKYVNVMSNIVVEFAFIIYMIILFAGVINRKTKKIKTEKVKFMPLLASIGGTILSIGTVSSIILTLINSDLSIKIMMILIIVGVLGIWYVNQLFLKKYPSLNIEEEIDKDDKTTKKQPLKKTQIFTTSKETSFIES